jgi:hypothetical protein
MAVVRRLALLALPAAALSARLSSRRRRAAATPWGMHPASYSRSGVSVVIPDNWRAEQGTSPLVASIASGNAT